MTRTSTLSVASVELVEFLRTNGASTQEEIHAALSPGRPHVRPLDTAKRMNNLRALGWIDFELAVGGAKLWYASQPRDAVPPRAAGGRPVGSPNKPKPVPASRDHLVQAPQYDRMHGPVWVATLPGASRQGAMDFQRCASHGVRC